MENIKINFSKPVGPMKPMHAVNNGPKEKSVIGIDNFDEIISRRLHKKGNNSFP